MAHSEDASTSHSFDEFAAIIHPLMKITRVKLLNFQRIDNNYVFRKITVLYVGIFLMCLCCFCSAISILLAIRAGNIDEATYMAPEFSIGLIMITRGLTLLFKAKQILAIFNELNCIFPQDTDLQQRMQVPRLAAALQQRFRLVFRAFTMSFVLFVAYPLVKFVAYHDKYDEVVMDFHQVPTWLPFGMMKSHKLYPVVYSLETVQVFYGLAMVIEWDQIFTLIVSQLCMHFEYLQLRILELNASESKDVAKSEEFYENLKQCIIYQQQLNSLGYAFSNTFNVLLLVSDLLSAAAICMHLYLTLNATDFMSLVEKLCILFLLFYLTYDIAKQGTQLQVLSGDIKEALYNHNWYEGSTHYRKYVTMWMQHASMPYKIAFEAFEVNMAHFQDLVMLSYQMLTFLKSSQ